MERPPSYAFNWQAGPGVGTISYELELCQTLTTHKNIPAVLYVPVEVSAYGG